MPLVLLSYVQLRCPLASCPVTFLDVSGGCPPQMGPLGVVIVTHCLLHSWLVISGSTVLAALVAARGRQQTPRGFLERLEAYFGRPS